MDFGEVAAPQEAGEPLRVASVGFYAITGLLGRERRRNDRALRAFRTQLAAEREARRARLVAAAGRSGAGNSPEVLQQNLRVVWDRSDDVHVATAALRDGDGDALLVAVQAEKPYIFHWTSLPHAALHRHAL